MVTLKEKQFLRLIEISKQFIDSTAENLTYQEMADHMLELSAAKHVAFNLYDSDNKELKTVALSGGSSGLKQADRENKRSIVNIIKDGQIIGEFILTIHEEDDFENQEIVTLYATQVGLLLNQLVATQAAHESKKYLERTIADSERLKDEYKRFFSINNDLFSISDIDGNLITVNDAWKGILANSFDQVKGQMFLDFVHPEDFQKTKEAMAVLKQDKDVFNLINRYKYCDGEYRYIDWIARKYDDLIYASGRDITENVEKQQEVEFLSFRDYLTGHYNRRYMEEAMKALDTSSKLPLTIMVVDVNGLKLTNDAFGHKMGDRLIKIVAEIIRKTCRPDDIIGRVGGDEFLILLPNTDQLEAEEIQDRMIKTAQNTREGCLIVSFAIGFAVKTRASQNIIEVERTAEKNMYGHKSKYGKIMRNETIETTLRNVFSRNEKEEIHAERVSLLCEKTAEAMGLPFSKIQDAKISGVLHDIGKIMLPIDIANKKGKLTKDEWEEMKRHPITSYNILKGADEYTPLAEIVLYHHENYDGTGYPEGLKKEKIPLLSRIISVADAYEVMTSKMSYKETMTKEEAIKELEAGAGSQFDPEIVGVFIKRVIR